MDILRIRWDGGEATFEPGSVVSVGRDPDADVQLRNSNVSRRHVEITHTTAGWVLRDVGSGQGTWKDGRQVETVDARGTVRVTLGREGRGEVITLEASPAPTGVARTEAPAPAIAAAATQIVGGPASHGQPGGAGDGTIVVAGTGPNRPGGALRADQVAGETVVTGDLLNVECAGSSYSFRPGDDVSIGRDVGCDVVSSNPTVSRRHARITHDGSGWTLRDEGSAGGTFVDGRPITERRLAGSVAAWLGDGTTGERVVIVASGTNPRVRAITRRRLLPLAAGAGALVLLLVAAGVLLTRGGDGGPTNDELGRATVRLVAGEISGSGTIIDAERGLILTNAHVVAPDAPGSAVRDARFDFQLDPSPREVDVLVAPELGKAAEPRFVAEVVAVDGYLDLAVLEITSTTGGQLVEPGSGDLVGLVEVEVGDSRELSTGDDVRVFGYPSAAQSSNVTLTEGLVSGQVKDERIGSNSAMLNISADISPGNSGGLAVDAAGELVGVPSLVRQDEVASMRPSELALAMIDTVRAGERYESPFFRPLSDEQVDDVAFVAPGATAGLAFDCSSAELTSLDAGAIGVQFDYRGFDSGEHQDLMVAVWAGDDVLLGLSTLDLDYPVTWPAASGCATWTVPIDTSEMTDPAAPLSYTLGLGPGYSTD